ncbi:MAG: transketolase [Thermodesulfobacteriota bacterium]
MSPDDQRKLDQLCVNTIRLLAVDMVEAARSGHPGLPLGAAPLAFVLWTRFLRHNPENPAWPNRDRFILSAGHGSALLYALLHLSGYDLPLAALRDFRQWDSLTPGHPEYGLTPGVEATSGPLGQGFTMGVGMALAETFLAQRFNRPGYDLIDHYTYALVSDGDLMEGISSEAASLAGTLGLGKIVYLYDDNGISIEGSTDLAFTEDVSLRFQAYGWQVIRVADGNDLDALAKAITNARGEKEKPSLIMVKTNLGYGSPKQDSAACHGEPLGREATNKTKEFFGWPPEADFHVPDEVWERFRQVREKGRAAQEQWQNLFSAYKAIHQADAETFDRWRRGDPPDGWTEALPFFDPGTAPLATRSASGRVLNALAEHLPNLIGGSADLAPSNKTYLEGYPALGQGRAGGRNIHFGVREHAMGAMVNGLALHGGVIPYGGTFLVFSDYMRPAIRLAALMKTRSIFVFTHDSIGVGEDGPTHQPVEHLAALRAIPGLTVIRPADANETVAAWRVALQNQGPTALILTRQNLPVLDAGGLNLFESVARGAYVLADCKGQPDVILIATGSEVHLALAARRRLAVEGVTTWIVSMPSWELFAAQPVDYREQVLPARVKARLAIEAGVSMGWRRWTGDLGGTVSVDRFGVSAPGERIFKEFGFTPENVAARAKEILAAAKAAVK